MKTITNLLLLIAVFYNSTRIYGNENSPDLSKPVAIISYYNKNVIDLPRGTTENGAKIASWTYNQQDNQLWWFQKENNGYIIISKFSRQVLAADPADSSVVQLPFDSNNKYQYWNILSFEDSTHIMNNELKLPLSLSVEKNNISLSKVESVFKGRIPLKST